jgi:hypothetical protein
MFDGCTKKRCHDRVPSLILDPNPTLVGLVISPQRVYNIPLMGNLFDMILVHRGDNTHNQRQAPTTLTQRMSSLLHRLLVRRRALHTRQPSIHRRPLLALCTKSHLEDESDGEAQHGIRSRQVIAHQELAVPLLQLRLQPVKVPVDLRREAGLQLLARLWSRTASVRNGQGVDEECAVGGRHPDADLGARRGVCGHQLVVLVVLLAQVSGKCQSL